MSLLKFVLCFFCVCFCSKATETTECDSDENDGLISASKLVEYIDSYASLKASQNSLINFMIDYQNGTDFDDISPYMLYRRFELILQGFAWLFKDINNLIWFYDKNHLSKYELAINAHAMSDGTHWRMFQYDWKILGLDNKNIYPSEVLEFYFGKEVEASRKALYNMMYLDGLVDGENNPLGRFIIIRSLEAAGTLLFDKMTRIHKIFYSNSKIDLMYLGISHFNAERGGLTDRTNQVKNIKKENYEAEIDKMFGEFKVTKDEFEKYKVVCERTVDGIMGENGHWDEMYKFSTRQWMRQKVYTDLF